jgi:uncharacterized protein (TIGR02186 family)
MRLFAAFCTCLLATAPIAHAHEDATNNGTNSDVTLNHPLVADISQNTIEIRSDFNGAQLLIFGARNVAGDIAIVVRGPATNATLRRKERIAGMWMHVDQRRYYQLPVVYALASTKPLGKLAPPSVLKSLGLGERRVVQAASKSQDDLFDKALIEALERKRWWQTPFGAITYFGESLFKARINLPDSLPSGNYTAEVYLFNRGQLLGYQTIPLTSYKTGFDASVANAARHNGLLYGIGAILMALFGGWLAHRLFHRP